MKKYFKQCTALLLLCVFMTTFLFAGPYNVVLADSLLNNGGFESGMWPLKTGGSIDTAVKHSGNQSAKLVAGTYYQYIGTDLIPVNRSDIYELSVWIKTANISTPDGVSVNVLLYNSSGTYRGYNEPAKLIKTGGTQDWTWYTVDVGNFAANDTIGIKISLKVDGNITGTVWFDDVVLQKKLTDNMIANPGFEAGWPLSQGGNYDTAVKHSGNQSAKLVGTTGDQYLGTGLIPVNPNEKYTLSAWIKTSGISKSDGVYLNALMADANGKSLGVCTPAKLIKTGGTQDWTQYTVDVGNFAAGTAFIRVYARADANITGTAWFDDAELYTAGIYSNLALNKTVTATSSMENADWGMAKVVDGQTNSIAGSMGWSSSGSLTVNHTESITVDLGTSYSVGKVNLFPRNDSGQVGQGFPIDFTIMVSNDNVTWTTVVAKTGYAIPGNNVQIFMFNSTSARYVKIEGTNLRQNPYDNNLYRMQFAELEVYAENIADYNNLAFNKTVTASSSVENSDWSSAKVVDGQTNSIPGYKGWTSSGSLTVNHTESITVNLGESLNIGKVKLFPRNDFGQVGQGFPIDFNIKVSNDNATWTTVVTKTYYPIPDNRAQSFNFNTISAQYVKIDGTNLRQNPSYSNVYRMQLNEVEVYAGGIEEITSVKFMEEPSNIMDVSNAGFDVTMNITGLQTIDYTIEYLLNGQTFTDKMTVSPGIDTVKQIRFTNPQKGAFNLQVNIKNGDRIVKTEVREIAIIEYYKLQFMDSYSREVMATHYSASSNASDQTDIDLMKKAGVVVIRDAIYWGTVEPQKGVWDFSKTDQYMKWLNDAGLKTYIILGFSNTNYVTPAPGVTDPSKCPPRTKAELDAFCEYVRQILTRYQNIAAIEVWNEPNWTPFWQPKPNVIDYATMIKAVSLTARQVRPDVQIMAGSLVYLNGTGYFYDLFGENLFPYIDGISSHPYYFPQSVDSALPNTLQTGIDVFDSFGGFKDNYASEVGLPTSANLYGIGEQGQAQALVKTYIYDDSRGLTATTWYDFRNDGTDSNNNEHNFGVTNKDYTPKSALAALSQRNNRLNGSVYQGEVNIGTGLQAHLYTKDGSPMLVAWNTNAGTAAVNIPNSRVEDMYGNVLGQSDVVNLDSSPKYIFGVPLNYYAKAVSYSANKAYDNFLNKWSSIYTNQTALMELKNTAMSLTDLPLSADALNLVQKNYNIGTDIINQVKSNTMQVTDQQLMSMLNDINRAGILWANLYAAAIGNEKITVTINSDALNAATQKVNAKISVENFASMYISQEILRHATRYNQRANEINIMAENPGKGQAVAFNNIMSPMLAGWVSQIADFEKVNLNTGVLLYADPSNITIYQGQTGQVNLTVDNRKRTDLTNVTAVVKDENGQEVFTSDSFNVLQSGSTSVVLSIPVPSTKVSGQYKYSITIKDNSGEITMESIFVVVQM